MKIRTIHGVVCVSPEFFEETRYRKTVSTKPNMIQQDRRAGRSAVFILVISFFPLVNRNEIVVGGHRHVGRPHDLVVVADFLHAVGAPARDPGDGEDGGEELHGQAQHLVNEARVEVE